MAMIRQPILVALSFVALTPSLGATQSTRVLTRDDFGTPTAVWLKPPPISGSFDHGQGLAVRQMPEDGWHAGHWHVYVGTFQQGTPNREPLLEYELPETLAGTATYVQTIGEIPHYGLMSGDGLFFDEASSRLCVSSGSQYTYADGKSTLACAAIDAATGKLTGPSQAWGFQGRPDRMTQSGILRVPSETLASKLKGHYLAGFGGTYSVISNGVSMGFAACAFDLPPQTFVGKIACTPVLGYPRNAPGATFMNRDPDYVQVLGWDSNPQRGSEALARYGTGKFAPEDGLYGMAADIVEIGGAAAFVGFAEMQRGCVGYGDNYFNLPPIVRDGPGIQPTDTDIASGVVTIPADWSTGRMVSLIGASSSGGLMPPRGQNFVYFLRKVGDRAFTFHPTLLDAQNDTNIKKPTAKITIGVLPVSYCQAPASPFPYSKGAVGSQGARHVLYFYDLEDLAAVAAKKRAQNSVQPTSFANVDLSGITYPAPGMNQRAVNGAQWIAARQRLALGARDTSPTKQGRRIWFYPPAIGTAMLPDQALRRP